MVPASALFGMNSAKMSLKCAGCAKDSSGRQCTLTSWIHRRVVGCGGSRSFGQWSCRELPAAAAAAGEFGEELPLGFGVFSEHKSPSTVSCSEHGGHWKGSPAPPLLL